MRRQGIFSALVTATLVLASLSLGSAATQAASESGSHAWSTRQLVLHEGPGSQYRVTGEIAADLAIRVLRCQKTWCVVDGDGGRGWTSIDFISFGRDSDVGLTGPNLTQPAPGKGEVCFYEGTNYTGASTCFTGNAIVRDLLLAGLDNRFSSVEVKGNVSVAVCRDRHFTSYCERIFRSQPVLDGFLNNNVSSIRLHPGFVGSPDSIGTFGSSGKGGVSNSGSNPGVVSPSVSDGP